MLFVSSHQRQEYGPIPGLAAVINYMPNTRIMVAMDEAGTDTVFHQKIRPLRMVTIDDSLPRFGDPIALRDALEMARTPSEARSFLQNCGPWLPPAENVTRDSQRIAWQDFQAWQQHFHKQRKREPSSTSLLRGMSLLGMGSTFSMPTKRSALGLSQSALGITIPRRRPPIIDTLRGEVTDWGFNGESEHPTLWISCCCALEAISAIVELERQQGFVYKQCVSKSCRKLFRLGSNNRKIFCDDDCQHREESRRRRERKPKEELIKA